MLVNGDTQGTEHIHIGSFRAVYKRDGLKWEKNQTVNSLKVGKEQNSEQVKRWEKSETVNRLKV